MMLDGRDILAELGANLTGLSADSRQIAAGEGFLAHLGAADDGRRHIPAALAAGAAAVFWEAENFQWNPDWRAPNRAIVGLRDKVGFLADAVYRRPSDALSVFAVTGTNGKTTITHFAAQLSEEVGASAVIGTLGAGHIGELSPLANTTPDAATLHALLRRFADNGIARVMLEASSHGIAQGRLNGARLAAAVFANAGYDHLDYHGDAEGYWASKATLFESPSLATAILSADDVYCAALAERLAMRASPTVLTYGKKGEALRLTAAEERLDGGFDVDVDGVLGRRRFLLNVPGLHNVGNFLASALVAHVAGVDAERIAARAPALALPSGRLQRLSAAPAVYIDYAHTPDAFAAVLPTMRPRNGRLLVVFGCGGGRDKSKRGAMGAAAAKFADVIVITDDNPRGEDAAAIRADIQRAAPAALNVADRKEAIALALRRARAQDVLLILGKGHEIHQESGGARLSFSDIAVAQDLLAAAKRGA